MPAGVPSHDFLCEVTRALFLGYSNWRSRELISEMLSAHGSEGSCQELRFERREHYIKGQVPSKKSAALN